jgi:hypothetical protein
MGMKNIKNNSIFFTLISFILFAAFFTPSNADAFYYVGWVNGNYIGCETELDRNGNFVGCGHVNPKNPNTNTATISNPVPVLYLVNPNSARIDSGTNVVTVTGINFIPTSIVRFNYSNRPTDYINSKTLKFQLNPSDLSSTGDFAITVANPGPGGGVSNIIKFNVSKNQNQNVGGTTNNIGSNTFVNPNSSNNYGNDLSANAFSANRFFSTGGFMPSTFLQWVVLFFLVLFIVILWRKIYVSDKDRSTPLKHA